MTLLQLFLDDEGEIGRRQWWYGTVLLLVVHAAAGLALHRLIGARHLDGPAMIFLSIAILIPFHAVNAKRFRAIGRSPLWALWGGVIGAVAALQALFMPSPVVAMGISWATVAVIAWYIVDLGLFPHRDRSSQTRLDGIMERA